MTALPAVLARSAVLAGRAVRAVPIAGGTSNRAYRLEAGDEAFCLRVPRPRAARGVDRVREVAAARAADAAGIGAPVREAIACGADGPLLLLGWVEGAALVPSDLAAPGLAAQAARVVRRLHAGPALPGPPADYAAFLRAYRADADRAGIAPPPAVDAGWPELERACAALATRPDGLAPCHDDLVAANLLATPSGDLVLLDFEFAAQNDPWLDVGTLWSLNGLAPDALPALCAVYADGVPPRGRVERAWLWALVAHAAFALWGLLEDAVGGAPVDLGSWARAEDARVAAWLADPALGERLDRVAR